ncbi:MAG: BrnT family toxin [Bdellovibrionia bacterium]
MKFDEAFDRAKSEKTKKERGLDFIEARSIWLDENCVTLPAKNIEGEFRWFTVGKMGEKLWVSIWTYRREDYVRIISVRRAEGTPFERCYYESQ